jgi:mannan endo-1,4-beta-mannosidase
MRHIKLSLVGKLLLAVIFTLMLSVWSGQERISSAEADELSWTLYEAEYADSVGTTVKQLRPGYSGDGYVTDFERAGDAVHFTVTVAEDGFYPLRVGYASPYGDKTNFVEVNGTMAAETMFVSSDSFTEIELGLVELDEGENRIDISTYWGYFDVDYIKLGERRERQPVPVIEPTLVTPEPSREAIALMTYMTSKYGSAILTGQQRLAATELDYIYAVSGKLPVISGFSAGEGMDDALQWAKYGGIVTMEWHWYAPSDGYHWAASETEFDVERAVTPGTREYELTIADIDRMAAQLLLLKEAGVPVLWRPLHEAEGRYFWWGEKGPEATKKLYNLLFDRFVYTHGLNNLIWVWTTSDTVYSKDWYPGDDRVDILGVDRYMRDGDYSPLTNVYDKLNELAGGKKLVAYTENGPIPDPREMRRSKTGWMYFNTWAGKFITDGLINSRHHIRVVYNHPYAITLDEFPSELIYGRPPEPYPAGNKR